MVDPEMQRRWFALMDAGHAAGHDVGAGGAGRTVEGQEALFYSRHHEVSCGAKHCCTYKNKCYQLNTGAAHAAPPGKSYHEPTTPLGHCLAIDAVGWQDHWLRNNAHRFGLDTAEDASTNEEWHVQPIEIPTSRSNYKWWIHHPLPRFQLPGDPPIIIPPDPINPGGDMPTEVNTRVYDTRYDGAPGVGSPLLKEEARSCPASFGGTMVQIHVTVIPQSPSGFLKIWEPGKPEPGTSVCNWTDGKVASDVQTVKMKDSRIMVKASDACHIILDNQVVW
jgi:hypothetical protein